MGRVVGPDDFGWVVIIGDEGNHIGYIDLDEISEIVKLLTAQPSVQADGSKREPTIIKSFPMQNAYPAGHKSRRRR